MKARLPQGVGGGSPSNMNQVIRQAQKMREEAETLQEELNEREYTVNAGGGSVTVKINGRKEIIGLDIKPELVDPEDIETLQDVLIAGINEAIKTVEETNTAEMEKVTGNINIPGLF